MFVKYGNYFIYHEMATFDGQNSQNFLRKLVIFL